ncbi:MAG: S-layer homology domain-containing protein [Oscillospiraceae bacterium]|nr:S-layer homology domain-containing protein [Oscillospiraceae bacterium]
MNRSLKRPFSFLLALSLMLSLGGAALAVEPTDVWLDKTKATIYLHEGEPVPVELAAVVQPSDFIGPINWSASDGSNLKLSPVSTSSNASSAKVSIADPSLPAGGTVTVTAFGTGKPLYKTCAINVQEDSFKSSKFDAVTVEVGERVNAAPSVTWASGLVDSVASGYRVENLAIADVSSKGVVEGMSVGTTTLYATVGGKPLQTTVTVVGLTGLSLNRSSLNMNVGDEPVTLTATVTPASLAASYKPSFTSSNTGVAEVDQNGKVTAKAEGAAMITAMVKDAAGKEYTALCAVNVKPISADVEDEAAVGTELSCKDIYNAILSRYQKLGGSGNPTIKFDSLGSDSIGKLYETSSKTNAVVSGYYGSLSEVENMYFVPASMGRYIAQYSVSRGGRTWIDRGTITIEVTAAVKNIRIGVDSNEEYSFSESSSDGSTAERIILDTLGTFGSIRFGSISSSSSSGTLYTSSNGSSSTVVRSGTVVNRENIGAMSFSPNRDYTYQIAYTAYSGGSASGTQVASGTLFIGSNVSSSTDAVIYLDSVSSYRFSATTDRNSDSAAEILSDSIDANTGNSDWKYVKFDAEPAVNTCGGILYTDSSASYEVNSNTYIEDRDLSSLYFIPTQSGVFEIGYTAYSDNKSSSQLVSGKLRIVASNLASDTAALYYNVTPGNTIEFTDRDFQDWFVKQRNSQYTLEYVLFTRAERNFGTMYYDGHTSFRPGNGTSYYTASYSGSTNSSTRYLDRVSYTAPNYTGYQEILFTCYGRVNSRSSLVQSRGALRIFCNNGTVSDISYSFRTQDLVTPQESDFTNVYKTAINSTRNNPTFYIQLTELPEEGSLYYNYNAGNGRGTELTSSNVDRYPFYVNGASGSDSVSKLTYVPSKRSLGTYPVHYIAFSSDGSELYSGTITFQYEDKSVELDATDGYTFRLEDVYSSTAGDPVRYVVFQQPKVGKLYLNYQYGRGTLMPANTRLYTTTASNGQYPVTALTYIPLNGTSGTVSLTYTAYTSSRSYNVTLTMKMESRTSSQSFRDITAAAGYTWAANAVDFAAKWGLVNGVAPGQFGGGNTMARCDLVLILYRSAGSPAVTGTMPYSDVSADKYYYNSALWASQKNIMTGVVTGGKYEPAAAVSRQDFTRILYNYTAAMGGDTTGANNLSAFKDAGQISAYARDAMAWAVQKGYINGTSPTTLDPTMKATRSMIATLFYRYLTA